MTMCEKFNAETKCSIPTSRDYKVLYNLYSAHVLYAFTSFRNCGAWRHASRVMSLRLHVLYIHYMYCTVHTLHVLYCTYTTCTVLYIHYMYCTVH